MPHGQERDLRLRSEAGRAALAVALLFLSAAAWGHCDSLDGPVVADARKALGANDVSVVLKWVRPEREVEIREAFEQAMRVRRLGDEARLLADRHFFETLVRVHRAGEGEAFAGLKPAGSTEPGIAAADQALESGSSDELAPSIAVAVEEGIAKRFAAAAALRKQANDSVAAGREYVNAYVDYVHFVENVHRLAAEGASHLHHQPKP